jgi:hypothetical protein
MGAFLTKSPDPCDATPQGWWHDGRGGQSVGHPFVRALVAPYVPSSSKRRISVRRQKLASFALLRVGNSPPSKWGFLSSGPPLDATAVRR